MTSDPDGPAAAFDADALYAGRRAELARALADVDAAVERQRSRVRTLPGHPLPGTGGEVSPAAVAPSAAGEAAEAARRLHDLVVRRDELAAELRAHDLGARPPKECERAAVAWLNGLRAPQQLLDELVPDPALPKPPRPPIPPIPPRPVPPSLPLQPPRPPFPVRPPRPAGSPADLKVAAAILRFRDRQPDRRIRRLADLRAVRGVTAALLRHILHTGCVRLPDEPGEPARTTVGVLLPVRVETRFRPGRLRVRVVPDEPWFARHDERVSAGEVAALERYLAAVAAAPDEPARQQAWRELVGQAGGARAVFLLRALTVPGPDGRPVVRPLAPGEVREEPRLPRVEGFPRTLQVWLARGGAAPAVALTLTVDRARLLADFPQPDVPGDRRWWESWDEAVDAGLAGEIALDGEGDDIDVLYVTGLDDGDPAALFASHRDEGRLSLVAPGTPTNSVDGGPAAPLAQDPDTWWEVLQTPAGPIDRLVSAALTGEADLLGNLPGFAEPHREWSAAIVDALWPALWGFAGSDVWAEPPGTHGAAAWATHALLPEGPFPTLRVGPQPYGLLPATALARWAPGPKDPAVEEGLREALLRLRSAYAAAAEGRGTVVGASTEQLLDLIGQVPTSPALRHRQAWPLELWWLVLLLLSFGTAWDDLDAAWRDRYRLADELGLQPVRRYGAVGAPRRLEIPLVVPDELPEGMRVGDVLHELVRLAFEGPHLFANTELLELELLRFPPDSLLLRLAIRSLQVAIGDVGRALAGEAPPGPEPVVRDDRTPGRLQGWIEGTPSGALHEQTAEAQRFRRVADGLLALAEIEPPRIERLLRATVDTAALRIDPWLVGLPTRRLQTLVDEQQAAFALGAYGWVDRPSPGGAGPTAAGLLLAPSPGQAMTATVLRDRAINDPSSGRWDLDLTSRSVRDADRTAEHVRVGAHLAEALGREVERVVADPADVARLRRDFPVRTEHEGRRVCDGLAVLAAAPASLGLDRARLTALEPLRAATDAYGDLLVAEAVHHVTQGRAEVAGAVMDAAAGLGRPPHLGLLRTPREGRAVLTSIVLALGDVAEPALPATDLERAEVSPAALADAAAEAFVRVQVGDAAQWELEVAEVDAAGAPVGSATTVTLADLGLRSGDALALPRADLERLAAEAGAAVLGVEPVTAAVVGGSGRERYERAARLVALVGRHPAGPDAVTEQADAVVDEAPVTADLLARYTLVRATARTLVTLLGDEVARTAPDGRLGTADAATLTRLVVAARSWGVAPDPPPSDPAAMADPDDPAEAAERRLVATAARALDLLAARLDAAPGTDPPAPSEPAPAATLGRDDLVDALAALVSPTGQLAVTGRLPAAALPTLQVDPALDRDWLPTVAAVRDSLARVEVNQLAAGTSVGGAALTGWSTRPGDPWQRTPDPRRMVVAYADPALNLAAVGAGARVAVAAVDRFAEVVPEPEQTTGAAFGFNAPAARAPQAILLAVPPDLATPLDAPAVLDVVAETRLLAHARMARVADLPDDLRGLLPASLLPASGATGVPLNRTRR